MADARDSTRPSRIFDQIVPSCRNAGDKSVQCAQTGTERLKEHPTHLRDVPATFRLEVNEHFQSAGTVSDYVATSPRNAGGPYQPQSSIEPMDVMASSEHVSSLRTVLTGNRNTRYRPVARRVAAIRRAPS